MRLNADLYNCFLSPQKTLESLKVPYSFSYLKECILSHPHFPSLLAISDTFEKYNISQLPLKIAKEKLDQVSLPCIVQVSKAGKELFYTLTELTPTEIVFYDETGNKNFIGKDEFLKIWNGIVILVEKNEDSVEPNIEEKLKVKRVRTFLIAMLFWMLLTLSLQV